MKKIISFLFILVTHFNSFSQILSDTIRGVNCKHSGFIHTKINGIFTSNGGNNSTNWYYLDTLSGNWNILNNSSNYIADSLITLNNTVDPNNYFGLSTDSITTKIGGTFKLEIVDLFGNIVDDTTWFIRYPLGIKLCCHVNVNCYGDSTGSFKAVGHSGNPSYIYSFSDSSNMLITSGLDSVYNNLPSGKYYISVIDSDSCSVTSPEIIISEPMSPINVKTNIQHVDCIGNNNGIISIKQEGGKPFSYGYDLVILDISNDTFAFSNSSGFSNNINFINSDSLNISNLSDGTYFLNVIDSNGCSFDSIFVVNEPGPYHPNILQIGQAICDNDSVLLIIDSIFGTTGPVTYAWDLNKNDSVYSVPDTLSLTVIDTVNNCIDTLYYSFQALTKLKLHYSTTDVLCSGDSTGEIFIDSITGGKEPYNVSVSGNNFTNLRSGTYFISVYDSNSCFLNQNIKILESELIKTNAVFYKPSCYGISDGSISINPTGGLYPYVISWANGQGNVDSLFGIPKGSYTVNIIDSAGCLFSEALLLNQPDSLSVSFSNYENPLTCRGQLTTINAVPSGGTPPFNYVWSSSDTTFQSTVGAGNHICYIADKNGCKTSSIINIFEPSPFSIENYITKEPSCDSGADVRIVLTGGTKPYNYFWSNGDSLSSVYNIQTSNAWVVVSDFCESTDSIFFDFQQYYLQTSLFYDNISHYSNIEIDFSTSNGPFTYLWTDINSNIISSSNQAGPLCEGTYFITTTDSNNGCSKTDTLLADFFTPNGIVDLTTTTVLPDFELWGYAPYSYLWDDGSNGFHADLCPGNHWVEVTDVNGCTVREDFIIDEINLTLSPNNLLIECDISNTDLELEISAEGGIPPYQILWSDGKSNNPINIGLSPGIKGVKVTDNNNCSVDTNFRIFALSSECIPNVFSPNNDQVNDTWKLEDSYLFSNSIVKIYNRYGKLIFESEGYTVPWDGTNKDGENLSDGCYFYYIKIEDGSDPIKGTVSIVR